ncbi:MAG: 50S ribosome-binding GTPase [candidate division WOR-3 bacterium]|nr:50S ribosome-binding GTPase [candidate division WOR-3 bacterium]
MPANLPPQYFEVEKKYREAKTLQEKLFYLQELLAVIPKHKGTEKLQAELKAKISKTKELMEKSKKSTGSTAWYQVERQGAGQVVLVGLPNCGKSSLLNILTRTNVEVAPYPFTTTSFQVGMMEYEDIKIQIVDTPPVSEGAPAWLYAAFRFADLLLILLDASSDNLLEQMEIIKKELDSRNIFIEREKPEFRNNLILLNKMDINKSEENSEIFLEFYEGKFNVLKISTKTGLNIETLKQKIFENLNIIRVYTKKIGQPVERKDPIVLKIGATVIEAAEHIHKDFKKNLKYTRLWNARGYNGQRVEKNYILQDGDIVEFHV